MSTPDQPLASLSLTHVHYNPHDSLSYACAWLALVPQALCVVYASLIWASREVEIIIMFAGQLGCEALNFALKRLIREERPKYMHGKGYGMPSSHAQFVAYFSCYLSLFLLSRQKTSPLTLSNFQKIAISLLALGGAGAVSISRLYLNYHTRKQVLAGFIAGTISSIAWFSVISYLRSSGWIDWALSLPLSRGLRIRDMVVSEDLTEAGWQRWEAQRKLKQRETNDPSHKSD